MLTEVKINGVDVTSSVIKWKHNEEVHENIRQLEITLTKSITEPTANQTITVKRGSTIAQEQFIFDGYVTEISKEVGLYNLNCKDKMLDLIRNEVTYSYDKNVDSQVGVISDIFTDLINTWGGGNLVANGTTVQDSGAVNVLTKFICNHEDVYKKCEELASYIDWQFYYKPVQSESQIVDSEEVADWTIASGAQDSRTLNTDVFTQGSAAVNFIKGGDSEDTWYTFSETSGTTLTDDGADSNDGTTQQDIANITNPIIGDFEGSLDGWATGCSGSPTTSYELGYDGTGQCLKMWPTASDWLACLTKDMGDVYAGDEFFFYAYGDNVWFQIYNGNEAGNNSYLHSWNPTTESWDLESGYHAQTSWTLYRLQVKRTVISADYPSLSKMYIYSSGEDTEVYVDKIRKGYRSVSDELGQVIHFNGVSGDGENAHQYILKDNLATTNVLNTGAGADATCSKNTALMSSLVLWAKCEDNAANTTVVDSSGKGNTGTASVNTSLLTATGKKNLGFSFLQTENVNFGDISGIDGSAELTVCGWFYAPKDSTSADIHVFSKGAYYDATAAFGIQYDAGNNRLGMSIQKTYKWSQAEVNKGAWNFYAISYDGANNYYRYYCNGVTYGRDGGSDALPATIAATGDNVLINADKNGQSHRADLRMDEPMIFLRSLTDGELDEIYNSGTGVFQNIVENSPMGSKMAYFDGGTDILTLGNIGTPTTYLSVESWVKPDALGSYMNIAVKGTADAANQIDATFQIDTTGHLVLDWNDGAWHTITSTGTVTAGEDTQVAVTYDSWLESNNCKFYINGTLDSEFNDDVAAGTALPNNTSAWYIGDLIDNSGPFKGYIGNTKISTNSVFSAREIAKSYNSGSGTEELQDYITMASTVVMDLTSGCSVEFWMNTQDAWYTNLIAKEKRASAAFLAFNGSNNQFIYEPDSNLFGGSSDVLTTEIDDGQPHHYIHTWVINGANVDWNIYVDGVLESTQSHTKPTLDTMTFKYIGINGSNERWIYGSAFKGDFGDLRFYKDRLLDATDAVVLYNSGSGTPNKLGEKTDVTADTTIASTDLSNETIYFNYFIKDATVLAKMANLAFYANDGTGGWNKWIVSKTTSPALAVGWNKAKLKVDDPTSTEGGGTDETAITKFRVRFDTTVFGDIFNEGDIIVDNIYYYANGTGLVYFEPKGYPGQNGTLTVGTDTQKNLKWNTDSSELLNEVTVFGAKQDVQAEKTYSGDDLETDFAIDFTPTDVRVEHPVGTVMVGGVNASDPNADYYVDKTRKLVRFITAPVTGSDNVYIRYSYAVPVPVTGYSQASQTAYGTQKKTMFFDDIQTVEDAELKVNQLITGYALPFISTTLIPTTKYDLEPGQTVEVIDTVNGESRVVLVDEITQQWPHTGDQIKVGDKTWKTANWQVEVIDRIQKLEEQNARISDYLVHVVNLAHSITYRKKSLKIYKTTYLDNDSGGIYGNPLLGIYGSSKYGVPDTSLDNEQVYGIVSQYKLNDNAASTTVIDSLGTNNGTASENTSGLSATGKVNNCFSFNGVDQQASLFNLNLMPIDFSIAFWARIDGDDSGNSSAVLYGGRTGNASAYGFRFERNTADGTAMTIYIRTNDENDTSIGTSLSTDWNHYILTKVGTTMAVYKNNVFVNSKTLTQEEYRRDSVMVLGNNFNWFNGSIDDLRFYAHGLTTVQRSAIYNDGSGTEVAYL